MFAISQESINISLAAAIIGALINITLSCMTMPFATSSQISPPNGAVNLGFFSQIMHMLVHHNQVLFTSSLIIFVIVFLSTNLAFSL
jgi:hypothetical protein